MTGQVLVAYATKYGATEGIAEKIAEALRQAGLTADVLPISEVGDLSTYQAVVLGSAVYIGKWQKGAAKFLRNNEQALAQKPLWLFSSGPTDEGDPEDLMDGWVFPKDLQPIADRIEPRGTVVFSGVMDPDKLNRVERWMIKNIKAPTGDFRDWDAISDWAGSIAAELN